MSWRGATRKKSGMVSGRESIRAGSKVKSNSLRDDEVPKPSPGSAQLCPNVMRLRSWAQVGVSVTVVPRWLSAMADELPKWGSCGHRPGGDKKSR